MNEIILNAYQDNPNNRIVMSSSMNPGIFFSSPTNGDFKEIFIGKDFLK